MWAAYVAFFWSFRHGLFGCGPEKLTKPTYSTRLTFLEMPPIRGLFLFELDLHDVERSYRYFLINRYIEVFGDNEEVRGWILSLFWKSG